MKNPALILALGLALAASASSQEVFDLLRKGDVTAVKAMVEKSPRLAEARDGQGLTLLHYAAYGRSPDLVNFLIDRGANAGAKNTQGQTPLHVAAMNDGAEVAGALLKRGAGLEARDDYGRTALVLCARERGQLATVRVLVEAGADVNAADKFGSNALELAAWRGKGEVVDYLLDKGAGLPKPGEKWDLLLHMAASQGLENLFKRLAGEVQDLKAAAGMGLLRDAAEGGSAVIVGLLLEKGFDPAEPDRFGWTPLHYAARDGRVDAARALVGNNAPLDARTIMGQTAFNIAQERKMEAVAAFLADKGADKSDTRFPVLEGDYLGQKPPGNKPELFAPGIVSSIWGLHSTAVFSPDGNEVYWAPMMTFPGEIYSRGGLLMMRRAQGRWTPPAWAPFSGPSGNDDVPFFSADGKRLYFISRRPLPGESERGSEKIWFVDRTPGGWLEPRPLAPNVNSLHMHWEFSLDNKGNVYFAGNSPGGLGMNDIYSARFVDGKYEKPVNAGPPINSAAGEESPFIAPDGSYLLFSRQYDLWVSFRGADGAWSEPVNLGPGVNSPEIDLCPIVTADGKYLFFLSQRDGESHAYWVSTKVLDDLKAKAAAVPPDEYAAVKKAIEDSIGWAIEKDFDAMFRLWADDLFHFWLFSDSKVVGLEAMKKHAEVWRDPEFRGTRFEFRDLRIVFSRSGDVAWYSCLLDDCSSYKGKESCLKDVFQTGVLEKRDGRWVHTLMHGSYPVDKVPENYVRRFYSGLFEKKEPS
jgi:ankyrin repeat protein/ketosteroid isomerase-like protein